ncbi:protein GPR108 isoform X2 [Microcaecilia unicolor]|uniref:Protein GPR108 isoform X2 n=1 Tax=Microcaecilia unicolor TaxID=1415580 RepID=A0A6P7XJS0_9AMPH|nr:protein GPR108 isoform X2 [Microcaecilia unicolor]
MMAERKGARCCFLAPCLLLLCFDDAVARIHKLRLTSETRSYVHITSFGFYTNGTLEVDVSLQQKEFSSTKSEELPIGFTLSRSKVGEILSSVGPDTNTCVLDKNETDSVTFIMDVENKTVKIWQFGALEKLRISSKVFAKLQQEKLDPKSQSDGKSPITNQKGETKGTTPKLSAGKNVKTRSAKDSAPVSKPSPTLDAERKIEKLTLELVNTTYSFSFHIAIGSKEDGLYSLNFYNCYNMKGRKHSMYNLTVGIVEKNPEGYLSAAELPLIKLYLVASGCFFIAAVVWMIILLKHKHSVFKIHWLMAALTFTKGFALLFHSVNYYVINTKGQPIESLAVMYYITHILKGALLFITILLIGSGWAFIKYILSDKEKKIFMIVLPLQILANVAYIILESSEEGSSDYAVWMQILFLVDLICCGSILFPVIWSIRHLQEASNTDGKLAINLAKLKLFRHYYVMVVCYIYFTRIIAILLKVIVPFQWQWLHQLLVEVSTFIFFILTGYKFQPACNNPYLQLPQDEEEEDDIQMDEVVTNTGLFDGLSRLKKVSNGRETSA